MRPLTTADRIWPFHPSTPFGHLLTDEGKRRAAGQRARERVLREHTYRQRARELVRIV